MRHLPFWLLLLASALLLCTGLDVEPLYDWDEAWYGQIVKELLRSGDRVTLTYRGEPFFDKPPLAIWLMAIAVKLLGPSEWAIRLPSAVCGVLTVAVVHAIGRMLFERERAAWLSAAVLLTSLPFVRAARFAMLDAPLTLAFSCGVASYLAARREPRWGVALGLSLGLVWFIKGPLALLLLIILVLFAAWERDARVFRAPWWLLGLLGGSALVLPWYVLEWQRHGMAFVQAHFGVHVLGRASVAMDGHREPPGFYLIRLLAEYHPHVVFLVAALAGCRRRLDQTPVRLALCWWGGVFGAFSLAATKLPWYVAPAYPGLALLLGGWLDGWLERESPPVGLGRTLVGYGAVILVAGTVYLAGFAPPADRPYLGAAGLLGVSLMVAGWLLLRGRLRAGTGWVLGGAHLAFLALIPWSLHWETRQSPSFRPLARAARMLTGAGAIATLEGPVRPSFMYYMDRPEQCLSREELVRNWPGVAAAVLRESGWLSLRDHLPGARVLGQAGGLVLVAPTPRSAGR